MCRAFIERTIDEIDEMNDVFDNLNRPTGMFSVEGRGAAPLELPSGTPLFLGRP